MVGDKIIPCRWHVKLQIKPSLSQSEAIEGFNFEVNNGETFVNINYETLANDELYPDRSEDVEYADQTLAFKYIESIRKLMLARMVYQRLVQPLSVEIVSGPTLINHDELSNAGLLNKRTVGSECVLKFSILDVGDTLSESTAFWNNGFKSKSKGHENDVLRIIDWLQRAATEKDSVKSFILTWIAFNGIYGLYASICKKSGNKNATKFESLIDGLLSHEAATIVNNYSNTLNHLGTYGVLSENGKTNWSENLQNKLKSGAKEVDILKVATRCIYGVRGQVFHEAPEPLDVGKRAEQCKGLLGFISLTALRNFVN
jgi:hypothetical protein